MRHIPHSCNDNSIVVMHFRCDSFLGREREAEDGRGWRGLGTHNGIQYIVFQPTRPTTAMATATVAPTFHIICDNNNKFTAVIKLVKFN